MTGNTVRLHRVLAAKPEKVYRAFVEPDAMARWSPPDGEGLRVDTFVAPGHRMAPFYDSRPLPRFERRKHVPFALAGYTCAEGTDCAGDRCRVSKQRTFTKSAAVLLADSSNSP